MHIDKQNRFIIPVYLRDDMQPLPEDNQFRVFYNQRDNCIIFSNAEQPDENLQIAKVSFDNKYRIWFNKKLVALCNTLLNGQDETFFLFLNRKKELCMKKIP